MISRQGVRERGIPQFVLELNRARLMSAVWDTHLAPLTAILEQPDDEHVLQAEGGKASTGLWVVLRAMPSAVAGGDAAEFLLGYVPHPSVNLPESDATLLVAWHRVLRQCFQWAITWQQHDTATVEPTFIWNELVERRTRAFGPLITWRDELFALVDEVDTIVAPRIVFWHERRDRGLIESSSKP